MREVKPHSLICKIPNGLRGGICREAIRRFGGITNRQKMPDTSATYRLKNIP